jgi:uroporphyrinogen decarboxylase
LLNTIADYNIAQARKAMTWEIDAVYFGDDWGQQSGLIMGKPLWDRFLKPVLRRMYDAVHEGGRRVFIHSCGAVDSLFDDLVEMGVNCFNPFQPEVMDIWSLVPQYRGRLAFHGGLSTQHILPYEGPDRVRAETEALIELGSKGGYILAPAHDTPNDVPLENMLAFIRVAQGQPAYDGPVMPAGARG